MQTDKLKALLDEMTLEEKVGQLLQLMPMFFGSEGEATGPMEKMEIDEDVLYCCGSVLGVTSPADLKQIQDMYLKKSKRKIPLLFMLDVIHGFRTIFPIPLAMGCTFCPDAAREAAEIAGKEAAVSGVMVNFSPMADLVRDPRWGRVMESTGEDAWLNGLFAEAMVKGYQENKEEQFRISACVKHFAAYGAVEGGREYNTVDISDWMLREYYLPAYKAALKAGSDMVMASFNTINGIPAAGNEYLLRKILRDEWGYEGAVISDWGAVSELITHGVAENGKEAAFLACRAGIDIEMMTPHYVHHLTELVKEGKIRETIIDEAVWRILQLKNKRGLFENPYGAADEVRASEICLCAKHREKAREIAVQSMVLLKNNGVLPLKKSETIALIGPMAKENNLLGGWGALGRAKETVSLYEGISEKISTGRLIYEKGCDVCDSVLDREREVRNVIEKADTVILALGEAQEMTGEASSLSVIRLSGGQEQLLQAASQYHKPVVVILFNSRPMVIGHWLEKADSVLEAWFPGTEGGHAAADILFGDREPTGRLSMSFPVNEGQIPVYYNSFSTGRPKAEGEDSCFVTGYLDIPNEALFPFGYGLSYTSFEYSDLKTDRYSFGSNEICHISVCIKNVGMRTGEEVVQMYLQDEKGCVVRPVRELKGFKKVRIDPGELKTVEFELSEDMLYFHDSMGRNITQTGNYTIYVGGNSLAKDFVKVYYHKYMQ